MLNKILTWAVPGPGPYSKDFGKYVCMYVCIYVCIYDKTCQKSIIAV